uniref:Uncharacterized protein n=1 Tax=Amphimedon queenslandica TaxID=400682 RepID=A0A1X7TDC5_AMPQE
LCEHVDTCTCTCIYVYMYTCGTCLRVHVHFLGQHESVYINNNK